jgi:hypothetical protein
MDVMTNTVTSKHEHTSSGFGGGAMSGGILIPARHLLFTEDSGNLRAFAPATGTPVGHQKVTSPVSNGPETRKPDGKQYMIAGAGHPLYGFTPAGSGNNTQRK